MADLTPGSRRRDRGQIILIAAFIIAASFVVLALIVNSAIFTENLATRDDVAGSQDALEHRNEVTRSVGTIVTRVNQDNSLGTAEAKDTVPEISLQGGLQQSSLGRVVDVEFAGEQPGEKIAQDIERNFTSNESVPGPAPDWTLAKDVNRTRNVQFNLTEFDNTTLTDITVTLLINDSDDEWEMTIVRELVGGTLENAVELEVDPPNASPESCERTFGEYVTIDVTGGTFDGEPCHALTQLTDGTDMWLGTDVEDPHDIQFTGDIETVVGTYSMIVSNNSVSGSSPRYVDDPEAGPYTEDAVYSLDVSYSYYTAAVGYESEIRVAPGEVPP